MSVVIAGVFFCIFYLFSGEFRKIDSTWMGLIRSDNFFLLSRLCPAKENCSRGQTITLLFFVSLKQVHGIMNTPSNLYILSTVI